MVMYYLISVAVAFLIATVFGKRYIAWLKDHGFSQPLKKEVEQMYNGDNNSTKKEDSHRTDV